MSRPRLRGFRSAHPLKKASVVVAAAAMAAAGLGAAPASSAPDSSCPTAYPVADLTAGQDVTGLTVSSGTTPDQFTGKVLGVVDDGIAPDLDMIMVRLTSPEIDRVGGIWEGMSGSPVYASDGRLIGAVSYGLSVGPSPVAGVTPAADMQELLASQSAANPAVQPATKVALPRAVQRRVVASGAATRTEADSGMNQLKLPFGLTGLSQTRLGQVKKLFNQDGLRLVRTGTTSSSAGSDPTDIVPGGNIAAAMSYGDVTAAGVGTATAVCGNEVLAFGHPMNFTGPSTLTMHTAHAIYVQEDPTLAPFKMANIDVPPVGVIDQDRMAGIHGTIGTLPASSDVTSLVTVGDKQRTGTTHVSVPDVFPDIATSQLLADQDRLFDGIGKGSGTVGWTISGTREDGSLFSLTRNDIYADPYDLTFASAWDLYQTLYEIQNNGAEDVTINSVKTTSNLNRDYRHYAITGIKVREAGKWTPLKTSRTLRMHVGKATRFQVQLTSKELGTKTVTVSATMPAGKVGRGGYVEIYGGNSSSQDDGFFYYDEGYSDSTKQQTLNGVLKTLRTQPHNDQVVADLSTYGSSASRKHPGTRVSTGTVVDGYVYVDVRGVR